MPQKVLTVVKDGVTSTLGVNRDILAGVTTLSKTSGTVPLTDDTTSIQVTVAGHADISGIYTGTTVAGATWNQQGGVASISASGFNETDGYEYLLQDGDSDPQILLNTGAGFTDRPWKAVIPSSITITGIASTETLTVNRTADSGGGTMTATTPLSDGATSIQVTVAGHADLSGIYNLTSGGSGFDWAQQGGHGQIVREQNSQYNYHWLVYDNSDGNPYSTFGSGLVSETDSRPWKPANTGIVTIASVPETLTVNRFSDRKGESRPLLSKVVGGAAAAYSLRDLNDKAGNNKVVRVRRASDNHERDFLAKEVSNGTLKNWVNTQTVLPLDIQALEADGRTGDFLIAKAAYSLRSLGTRQATLAATGDTVARADGKFVAQVRRSSDDALKSFTADEVTDGTLLAFVNEDVTIYQSDFSAGLDGFSSTTTTTVTGNQDGVSDSAGTTKDNVLKAVKAADSQAYLQRDNGVVAGLTYTVSGSFLAPSANTSVDGILIKDGTSGGISANYPSGYLISDGTWTDFSFSYTATVSGLQRVQLGISSLGANPNGSSTGSTGDIVYIADLKFVETTSNGFVKTWYDQSVDAGGGAHGNHAVQSAVAEQPKIVNASTLLNELDFDGTDDSFAIDFGADLSQANSLFMVHQSDTTSSNSNDFFDRISGSPRTLLDQSGSNYRMLSPSSAGTGVAVTTDKSLVFALYNGASSLFAKNGTATSVLDAGTQGINQNSSLGSSGSNFYNGSMQEFIVYNSDQTDNRLAIEANIGEAYSITGIPAYDNTVDGFVETWYDQSGHGHDAVQVASESQPKIVNAGSLVTGGIDFLDGTETFLETTNSDICNVAQLSLFTVLTPHLAGSQTTPFSCGSNVAGSTGYGGWILNLNGYGDVARFQTQARGDNTSGVNGIHAVQTSVTSSETLLSFASTFPNASVSRNGETAVTTSSMNAPSQTITNTRRFRIGCSFTFRNSNFYTQPIKEIIVYTSDQSANRPAIEANINNQYDIY
jgi:hypothetical protein